jgi:hypothetical protein
MELLANARSAAVERGIPWKGLRLIGFSHESLDSNIPILQQYQVRACVADAIAVGHVTEWKAHLSSRATAIYSDYVFVIDALLKDNLASSIQLQPAIVVSRPGGAITLEDGPIRLEDKAYPALLPSTKYLLFLRYIPGTSGYAPVDSFSTFAATEAGWDIAGPKVVPRTAFTHDELETTIHNWLASCK